MKLKNVLALIMAIAMIAVMGLAVGADDPTTAPEITTEPEVVTTVPLTEGGNTATDAPTAAVTAAPAGTPTAPRGGVAFAIVPTVLAAGAVIASRKRK
jgi:hypothetical protein